MLAEYISANTQEILRLNNVLDEYISANTLLKKANINPEHHLKSEKVKEEQLDPASIKEEPTFDKGLKQFI